MRCYGLIVAAAVVVGDEDYDDGSGDGGERYDTVQRWMWDGVFGRGGINGICLMWGMTQ